MRGEAIDEGLWRRHAWLDRIQSLALLLFMGGLSRAVWCRRRFHSWGIRPSEAL